MKPNIRKKLIVFAIAAVFLSVTSGSLISKVRPTTSKFIPDESSTSLVRDLYDVLLDEKEPTIDDEKRLFDLQSVSRRLICELTGEKFNDPVILRYYRAHLRWFAPDRPSAKGWISISSTSQFLGSLSSRRDDIDTAGTFVIVVFPETISKIPYRDANRTLAFIIKEGRIDPDIDFDAFSRGRSLMGEVYKERINAEKGHAEKGTSLIPVDPPTTRP